MSKDLLSIDTLVQSPFIIATIGGVTFGSYSGDYKTNATYPNFMKSIMINKINGTVNTYTLNFEYQVATGQDPNLLDKIFSKAANNREIILKYGDWNAPDYIYKEEKCIITNLSSNLDMNSSKISYTLSCTSDAIGLNAVTYNFAARTSKGSTVLLNLLNSTNYGLTQIFTGMRNLADNINNNLIASNDKVINLEAKQNYTILEYINYVVNSMQPADSSSSKYFLTVHDDYSNNYNGTYFKVTQVGANAATYKATDTYSIDINYPNDNFVTQFSLNNDQSWSILYDYAGQIKQEEYTYTINKDGIIETNSANSLVRSTHTNKVDTELENWWKVMTEFPIEATLTIKGLTRPSILMSYVKLNVWFAGGVKHIASGTYIITKQVDSISQSGYSTTLTLLRVKGDE